MTEDRGKEALRFFDTHCHLNDAELRDELPEVLARARAAGVLEMANIGYDGPSSELAVRQAEENEGVYAVVGVHPHDADKVDGLLLEKIYNWARHPKVLAIGEIGLDYYRDLSPRDLQEEVFVAQLDLAQELGKPIVIHDRDAHADLLSILKREGAGKDGGIIHCFSSGTDMARQCIKMGFHIALGGTVTYKNARHAVEVARDIPLDRLLLETDCPYLSPHPFRGKRNEPSRIPLIAERIAEIRGISVEELARVCTQNAHDVYRLP